MASAPLIGRTGCWIPATGMNIPLGAAPVGYDSGIPVYVIRGFHNGALLPGKYVQGHSGAYVAWGGKEIMLHQYEVLCHYQLGWQRSSRSFLPHNAFVAGNSEQGEPLYIGKVSHNGAICIGKVQRSHGVCYIPYGGKEIAKDDFEVLVV